MVVVSVSALNSQQHVVQLVEAAAEEERIIIYFFSVELFANISHNPLFAF